MVNWTSGGLESAADSGLDFGTADRVDWGTADGLDGGLAGLADMTDWQDTLLGGPRGQLPLPEQRTDRCVIQRRTHHEPAELPHILLQREISASWGDEPSGDYHSRGDKQEINLTFQKTAQLTREGPPLTFCIGPEFCHDTSEGNVETRRFCFTINRL